MACSDERSAPAPEPRDSAAPESDSSTPEDARAPDADAASDLDGAILNDAAVVTDANVGMDATLDAEMPPDADASSDAEVTDAEVSDADAGGSEDAGACDRSFDLAYNTPDPTRDHFDADEVYVVGTLEEGACYEHAISHWSEPDRSLTGLPCQTSAFALRPTDGRMLYLHYGSKSLRAFACDGCTYAHPQDRYPELTLSNDPVIPTPPCDADDPPYDFRVSPEGEVIHACGDEDWYDATGALVLDGVHPLCSGSAGQLLLEDRVRTMSTGAEALIVGLPEATQLACRAVADGFWVALRLTSDPTSLELWKVELDGDALWIGAYSSLPATALDNTYQPVRIDVRGRLYQIVHSTPPRRDLIVRRSLDAASEVLYDELSEPILRLHISSLMTGPGPTGAHSTGRIWGGEIAEPSCLAPTDRFRYAASVPPPDVTLPELSSASPGPGVVCGTASCEIGEACCETFDFPDRDILESWKCSVDPDDPDIEDIDNRCSPSNAISFCDEPGDCADFPSTAEDPTVCCFHAGGDWHGRKCTTASTCAGADTRMRGFTAMIACQSDDDCALAGPAARCVWDAQISGPARPWVGRCDAPIQPPDGTQLLASSVRCGDVECPRVNDQVCCLRSAVPTAELDPLSIPAPTCERDCIESGAYTARSYCDEPSDCANPSAQDAEDPFECCVVSGFPDDPSDRECRRRSTCQFYACKTNADCTRIDSDLRCRPERTLTGGGIARPDVRTCQKP